MLVQPVTAAASLAYIGNRSRSFISTASAASSNALHMPSMASFSRLGSHLCLSSNDLSIQDVKEEGALLVRSPSSGLIKVTSGAHLQSLASKLNIKTLLQSNSSLQLNQPYVCGHRGFLYAEPENSLEGFLASAEIGCDAVELDVFLLKCGTLVVFHGDGTDESPGHLHNYCGIDGNILDYTAEEVRELKLNPECKEYVCNKDKIMNSFIPTLEDVFMSLKDYPNMKIKIELKGPDTAEPTLELVEKYDMVDRVMYSSFRHDRIARIRELRPDRQYDGSFRYKTGALFTEPPEDFVEIALSVGASEVHLKYDTCTAERVSAIHAAGMGSMAWFRGPPGMKEDVTTKYRDVQSEDENLYKTVLSSGVLGLCCNKPDVLLELLGRIPSFEESSAILI